MTGKWALTLAVMAAAGVSGLSSSAKAEIAYGTTLENFLFTIDTTAPGTIISSFAIQGLAPNEVIVGIDVRPATGVVYGLGSFGRLYTMNPANGVATFVASLSLNQNPLAPNGTAFGVDFNPVPDRMRVTSTADQNLRINVADGVTIVDGTLAYVAGDPNFGKNPNIVHSAYINNRAGATSTTLYNIDAGLDVLTIQNPPNAGGLVTVGPLGIDIAELGGFDVSGVTDVAYAALLPANQSQSSLYTIDLSTGAASLVGVIGGGALVTSFTVVIPEPSALGLLVPAAVLGLRRRR